jgi:hypothetical protein
MKHVQGEAHGPRADKGAFDIARCVDVGDRQPGGARADAQPRCVSILRLQCEHTVDRIRR